jgi:hypothetical protein
MAASFPLPQASTNQKQNGCGTNTVESVRMLISQKELHNYKRNTSQTTHACIGYLFIYLAHFFKYVIRSPRTQTRFLCSRETTPLFDRNCFLIVNDG